MVTDFSTGDPTPRPMARVCSWCHTEMTGGTHPATHGICPACIARLTDTAPLTVPCPDCGGSGEVARDNHSTDSMICPTCGGRPVLEGDVIDDGAE